MGSPRPDCPADGEEGGSLDFFVYTFTVTTNWIRYHEVKQDVLFLISEIVEKHGAEFAYPTQTLHLLNEEPQPAPNMTQ